MDGVDGKQAESVWDYPRPPWLEPTDSLVRVMHCGVVIAESRAAQRVLETSHPPVFYVPPGDVRMDRLQLSNRRQSFCEFKGLAAYWTLHLEVGGGEPVIVPDVAWSYPEPSPDFLSLRDYLAFYASRVDECTVDGERVQAQEGDFYGGWITSRVADRLRARRGHAAGKQPGCPHSHRVDEHGGGRGSRWAAILERHALCGRSPDDV